MFSESGITLNQAKTVADRVLQERFSSHLKDTEAIILEGTWKNLSYQEMVDKLPEASNYEESYLRGNVGKHLWKNLTEALGEKVSKSNCREALRRKWEEKLTSSTPVLGTDTAHAVQSIMSVSSSLSPGSSMYIQRSNIEIECCEEISCPGSLVRIRAPEKMGKTSLLRFILAYASAQKFNQVYIDLQSAEGDVFSTTEKFLKWFCTSLSEKLDLKPSLEDYWEENTSSVFCCRSYVRSYLLRQLENPLVIGIDNLDRIFEYEQLSKDFLALLRSWHEAANDMEVWQQLRLAIAHSTEAYVQLDVNQSPFNVGFPVKLPGLTVEQVTHLAERHGISFNIQESTEQHLNELCQLTGGHPFLIQYMLKHLRTQDCSFKKIDKGSAYSGWCLWTSLIKPLDCPSVMSITIIRISKSCDE